MCLVLVVCEAYVGTALQDLFVVVCMSFFELGNWLHGMDSGSFGFKKMVDLGSYKMN